MVVFIVDESEHWMVLISFSVDLYPVQYNVR